MRLPRRAAVVHEDRASRRPTGRSPSDQVPLPLVHRHGAGGKARASRGFRREHLQLHAAFGAGFLVQARRW